MKKEKKEMEFAKNRCERAKYGKQRKIQGGELEKEFPKGDQDPRR